MKTKTKILRNEVFSHRLWSAAAHLTTYYNKKTTDDIDLPHVALPVLPHCSLPCWNERHSQQELKWRAWLHTLCDTLPLQWVCQTGDPVWDQRSRLSLWQALWGSWDGGCTETAEPCWGYLPTSCTQASRNTYWFVCRRCHCCTDTMTAVMLSIQCSMRTDSSHRLLWLVSTSCNPHSVSSMVSSLSCPQSICLPSTGRMALHTDQNSVTRQHCTAPYKRVNEH